MYKILYVIPVIVILVYFGAVFTLTPFENDSSTTEIKGIQKLTGTPADNYEPHERSQHCGEADVKSNQYIQEFEIPTPCTQPLSIITDPDGNIWFTQTNTGSLAMFDPESETFTEYPNEQWTLNSASMIWGIVYTEDNEIWFTDDKNGSIWKFSIPEKTYYQFEIPSNGNKAFPQKIEYHNGNFMINDFTGNQVILLNHEKLDEGKLAYSSITVPDGFFTSQTSVDSEENIWFVMWKYQKEAILVKTNSNTQETEQFVLPNSIYAPNGVSVGPLDNIWIADTAGESFYRFTPSNKIVTEFVTSDPPVWTYGNSSGLIKTPITRPYWNTFDSDGNMWFNQQTANRLAVFNPDTESLVEYDIPSRNPDWSDCGDLSDCGLAQIFDFTFQGEQVWFTEWVENNIGVLDTTVPLPILISIDSDEIEIKQGQEKEFYVTITPNSNTNSEVELFGNTNSESITVSPKSGITLISDEPVKIPVTVTANDDTHEGYYKILIGTQFSDVAISSYATIKVG